MKPLCQLLAAMLLWSLIACHSSADKAASPLNDIATNKATFKSEDFQTTVAADSVAMPGNAKQPAGPGQTKVDWDKKIIKNGNLSLEVKSYKNFNELVHTGVKQFGGYIAQEQQSQSDYRIENVIMIKVPVDQFDAAVSALTPGSEKMIEKKITSEDVTGELVDTKSRMEAKKRVRDRYLDLLKQAKNMEEILQVQNEVNDIQENIEAAAGRINYLGHAAAFSTINLHFYQVLNVPVNSPEPSYGLRILESFKSGMHWFAELLVWIVTLWPLWTGIVVAWIFIKRKTSPVKNQRQVS